MPKKKKSLSQAEVWDDSALLQSWDDALAEYKLYHSIHARGERIEDVIRDAEAQSNGTEIAEDPQRSRSAQTKSDFPEELEDGELEEEMSVGTGPAIHTANVEVRIEKEEGQNPPNSRPEEVLPPAPTNGTAVPQKQVPGMPNAIVNGVQDEALKNLMMSWYYAGYYTGLYEGQQQASQPRPN